jgi:hypothetical protein
MMLDPQGFDAGLSAVTSVLDPMVRGHAALFSARDVSSTLWAYASMDHYERPLFDGLCARAFDLTHELRPIDCANILVAFGRFGHYQPDLLKAIPQVGGEGLKV